MKNEGYQPSPVGPERSLLQKAVRRGNVDLVEKVFGYFLYKDDKDWLTEVNVSLIAHPELTQDQQLVVRQEYFAKTMARITVCRGPLVNYFINNVGAAVDVEKQRPPEYFLAVENVKEISKWLFKKYRLSKHQMGCVYYLMCFMLV